MLNDASELSELIKMKRSRVFRIALYLLALFLFAVTAGVHDAHAQQPPPAPVAVAEVVQMDVAAGQAFVATVMPLKRAVVGSAVDGRVVELVVHEGERVAEGGALAKLLTATIELELAAAEAELDLRNQELAELEAGARRNEIEQAKAKMLGAKADMEFGRAQLTRLQQLRTSNSASQEEFDQVKARTSQSEQVYQELKAAYDLIVEGPRPERIAQARAQVAFQQAMVDRIKDRIKKYTVMSRFDGYVVAEHVDEGTWVTSGDPVMEVVALDEVEVLAYVVEQHAAHIKPGATVRIDVPALPGEVFTGEITTVIPQADAKSRTFPVKIRVKNTITADGPLLKAGMYARVELPIGPKQSAIMVPKNALVLGGPQPLVYVVDGDQRGGSVRPVPIAVGVAMPNLIQAKGPLEAGQLVVVEGNERLRPGQSVVISRVVEPQTQPASVDLSGGNEHVTD